jgi:hypothetical protein
MKRGLAALARYVERAAQHAELHRLPPSDLIAARLAQDMMPFSAQIQSASDNAKAGVGRLTGVTPPSFPDTESSFPELAIRIEKTKAFLDSIEQKHFDGSENRFITLGFKNLSGTFAGKDYLLFALLPNFFFHVTTAHDILRSQGVQIGKRDFLGTFG